MPVSDRNDFLVEKAELLESPRVQLQLKNAVCLPVTVGKLLKLFNGSEHHVEAAHASPRDVYCQRRFNARKPSRRRR